MTGRAVAGALLAASIAAGAVSDRTSVPAPVYVGGYRVLAADFHVHPSLASAAAVTPWDLVWEARRHGLDAFAITPHNQVFTARLGRWAARLIGGPTVIVGEEVRGPNYHLIALGIERPVDWNQAASAAIDDIHRQGGVAIAAHPVSRYWTAYDAAAIAKLDGSEVRHPAGDLREWRRQEMRQFFARGSFAAIGSTDYHGLGGLGMGRTYVFATDERSSSILDAIRAHRTVVFDEDGRAFGDPHLVRLAAEHGHVRDRERDGVDAGGLAVFSRIAGVLGATGLVLLGFRER